MHSWKIERWIEPSEIKNIGYSAYWNDEGLEKDKEFYVLDGNFSKMENFIKKSGMDADLKMCVDALNKIFGRELTGTGIELGAGNLWAVPHIFYCGKGKIEKMHCLEYSEHRLLKIGPKVLEHYRISPDSVTLVLGSFYNLKLDDGSMDFAFLFQSFHHADDPDKLLSEIRRVLKPSGVVIMIGEEDMNFNKRIETIYQIYFKHMIKFIISSFMPLRLQQKFFRKSFNVNTFLPALKTFFPSDPVLGDHRYTLSEYRKMFSKHGFKFRRLIRPGAEHCSFILALN